MEAGEDYAALMRAAQEGDQDSYRRLLELVQPLVTRYVRRRVRSDDATEDIAQDVLLTMHRVRHTYDSSRPFEPWFYSIVRSRMIDYLRREKRIGTFELKTETLPEVGDDQRAPDWERFLEVLETLPPAQREAFSLLKLEGLSTAEAAERVGVTVSALKVRAHRAYNAIKQAFVAEGE